MTRVGTFQARRDLQQSGLSGSSTTDDGDQSAWLHMQRNVIQGNDLTPRSEIRLTYAIDAKLQRDSLSVLPNSRLTDQSNSGNTYMSARHVILGLLRERSSHTYDVAIRFGQRLGPWQVNRGQVYRTVSALEKDGLIEAVGEADDTARSGPDWRLTANGAHELDRWISSPSDDVEPLRGDFLAKLAVAEPRHVPELLLTLDWYERELVTRLETEIHERRANATATDEWHRDIADCIADGAIQHRDAELTWVRRVREILQSWIGRADVADRDALLRRVSAG